MHSMRKPVVAGLLAAAAFGVAQTADAGERRGSTSCCTSAASAPRRAVRRSRTPADASSG